MERNHMIINAMALACKVDLESFGGVEVKLDDMKIMLENDKELYDMLEDAYEFGKYDGSRGLDTYERDYVFDSFAKFIGGEQGWPCNMDRGTEYSDNFVKLLIKYENGVQ